jgi:hypothetical protein
MKPGLHKAVDVGCNKNSLIYKHNNMYKKNNVRVFAAISIILSVVGLMLSVFGAFFLKEQSSTFAFVLGLVSWSLLLWASIIGYKLISGYNLDESEVKKVGIRIYLIILAFVLFLTIGLVVGLILSVFILSGLWGLKKNYDEWESSESPVTFESEVDNQ